MNSSELEKMLQELLQGIQAATQSGEVLSDELQGMLAQTLDNLVTRIDQVKAQEEQVQQPQQPAPAAAGIKPEISPDAQLLWVLSGQQPQAFISYLRTFPTPATQSLLLNPLELNRTIEQLSQMMPQGRPIVIDGIPHADLNSSNVWGAAYDAKSGKMRVRFQGGSEYEYDGIPKNIFNAFIHGNAAAKTTGQNQYGRWWESKVPSLGASLNQYIKAGGFPYRKIK